MRACLCLYQLVFIVGFTLLPVPGLCVSAAELAAAAAATAVATL